MSEIIPFSFPLNQGMHAFLRIRDSLRCLAESQDAYAWLQAGADVKASILGEQGRRPAIPEVIGLLLSMQEHLIKLADEHPEFSGNIQHACENMGIQVQYLRDEQDHIMDALSQHALLNQYTHAIKKYDWLGHKFALPQGIQRLWQDMHAMRDPLLHTLSQLMTAVRDLDAMLHDSVSWQQGTAIAGTAEINPENASALGLLVVGLTPEQVQSGLIPEVSGNRLTIRLSFKDWTTNDTPTQIEVDTPYQLMLVPIG